MPPLSERPIEPAQPAQTGLPLESLNPNLPTQPTPATDKHTPKRLDPKEQLLKDLGEAVAGFVGIATDSGVRLMDRMLQRGETLIAEHGASPNFIELARNLAAQAANEASQMGLTLATEAQIRLRAMILSAILALRSFIPVP